MYIRHRVASIIVIAVTTIFSYLTNIVYADVSMTAITVVSISVAVYIAAMSALLGSPYADRLKSITDSKIRGKSQLGVITTYLRSAGNCGVLTIIVSILYQIPTVVKVPLFLVKLASAIAFGFFAVNLWFLWLIFQFLATALINSAQK